MDSVLEPADSRGYLDRELKTDLDYWLEKLGSLRGTVGITHDHVGSHHGIRELRETTIVLDTRTFTALNDLARGKETLLLVIVLAAIRLILYRYSRIEDITIGTGIERQFHGVAGLNDTLVLRDRFDPTMKISELLNRTQRTLTEAYQHQRYPIQRLVKHLARTQNEDRAALYEVAVFSDAIHESVDLYLGYDVACILRRERPDRGSLTLRYRAELYEPGTIEIFGSQIRDVLIQFGSDPEQLVDDVALVSESRSQGYFSEFERSHDKRLGAQRIEELVHRQAIAAPSATAVIYESQNISYGELDRMADNVAQRILRMKRGDAGVIAIYLEHSPDAIVAILGVLKAGMAYVPLDPTCPPKRLQFILYDVGASVVLTDETLAPQLPRDVSAIVIDRETETKIDEEAIVPQVYQPTAYIIYTSGSTGNPKGVSVPHSSLINYIVWAAKAYTNDEPVAFPLYSSLAFDLTVTSIFTPLVVGGSIVVYPQTDVPNVIRVVSENRVAILKATPSHLSLIKGRNNRESSIQRIIAGGEALSSDLARQILRSFGGKVEIYNEYGPTEATVGCMIHKFDEEIDDRAFVPIGLPATNTRIYVLNSQMYPAAENELGEIYISGACLATGYINRPDIEKERFIDNPLAPAEKLYRTGDFARILPNHLVDYVGRIDGQVKFLGNRIELEGLRYALNQHEDIHDSVVAVRTSGERQLLTAYYLSRQPLDVAQLRGFLNETIPQDSLPQAYIHVGRMPLNVNGKIDYDGLPDPFDQNSLPETWDTAASESPIEAIIAGIWQDILAVPRFDRKSNFFELGGHSLSATLAMSRLSTALQIEIPLHKIFESPTVASLAEEVEALRCSASPRSSINVRLEGEDAPLSYAQQRLWFLDQLSPESTAYNISSAVRLYGRLDISALERALGEVVTRHEILRTAFKVHGDYPIQAIEDLPLVTIPVADLSKISEIDREEAVRQMVTEERKLRFELASAPLWRVKVLRIGPDEHVLLTTFHHIVADAWSLDILVREFLIAYDAFAVGRLPVLPSLKIQYGDFAAWQHKWLIGDVLESQLGYWLENLRDAPRLELPTDWARPQRASGPGAVERLQLSEDVSTAVRQLSRNQNVTPFMTFLAVFLLLLNRYSGQSDLVVGMPIAGRNRTELEPLIGLFANTLALRVNLDGSPSFEELLRRVREVAINAYEHQDLPFDKLVERLDPERHISRNPIFQVAFQLDDMSASSLTMNSIEAFPIEGNTEDDAKFDLLLTVKSAKEGYIAELEYRSDLFSPTTIRRMLKHLQVFLTSALEDTRASISAYQASVSSEIEQQKSHFTRALVQN